MKKYALFILVLAFSASLTFAAGQAERAETDVADTVVVYGTARPELLASWATMYRQETGRTMEYIRLSAGEMMARVQAEGRRPQADVIQGTGEIFLRNMLDEGRLRQMEEPVNARFFPSEFHHPEGYWWGYQHTIGSILINTERFARLFPDHDIPQVWEDFVRPEYRGEWIMPNPATSGTAFAFLLSQLQRTGEEDWTYIEKVAEMNPVLMASGVAPAQQVALGEYTFAVQWVGMGLIHIDEGFPVKGVVPGATAGEMIAIAAVQNGPNGPDASDHFINWLLGRSAQQEFADVKNAASFHSEVELHPAFPDLSEIDFVTIPEGWASQNRDRVLNRWQELLDAAE